MLRIRKKFSLLICGICLFVFLLLYLILNFKIPSDKQFPQTQNLLPPENRFNQIIEKARNSLEKTYDQIPKNDEMRNSRNINPKFSLNRREMFKEAFINANDNSLHTCPIQTDTVPQPDIQMLDIYKDLKFDNIDGGVWKQGWPITYQENDFNTHHKLKVFVVPHSHNDPGWIKTFDVYYENSSKHILSNMMRHLNENPSLKFIWAEISYFSRFYEDLGEKSKETIRRLVNDGQLEFVTGGWVMTDEANSHWLSVLMQLSEGQSWLQKHLNYTPKSSWSIDPFGYSPILPYILKKSGIQNHLIQRTHYSVKKRFAKERQLEFRWRQIWDGIGETELFTHMMPFYSYDIPHTCGPDPKICCQFDFKRLKGFGITCPWRVSPQVIDDNNVAKRAEMIVDQWKKKSQLYKTRSVLIPLGDDFRYDQSSEWEAQRMNYELLFEHINNNPQMQVEAKFGTLQDYFDSVREEKQLTDFPSLSGDFFTYADRDDHYWSGYYTSRPYHKRMDRVLLHYIRSAEMIFALTKWETSHKFYNLLTNARRQLSLFQHHDGITGTAKTHVVVDYADRMLQAVKDCKSVMQQGAYQLLTKPTIYSPDYRFLYFNLDDSRWPGADDTRTTIILGDALPNKHVVFFNSLPQSRDEIVEFHISKPFVYVTDFKDKKIVSQVSPVWSWHKGFTSVTIPQASTTKYRLLFRVKVPPMGLATYVIHSLTDNDQDDSKDMKLALISKNTILTTEPFSVNLGEYPLKVEFAAPKEISLTVSDGPNIAFSEQGLLKSMALDPNDASSTRVPTKMEFVKYLSRRKNGNSGAYLFLPNGEATKMMLGNPTILVQQGPLESSVTVGLPFSTLETKITSGSQAIEIRNLIDMTSRDFDDTEVSMRISSAIKSGDIFYTDLNGMNLIKRQRFAKLPLQANYYPIPSTIYIENESVRLTLLTAQPLGGSSLSSGAIEIMQDRRLILDDERGLGQGVTDNQPTLHIFRLILENVQACSKRSNDHPSGFLTSRAHNELQTMLHPIDKFIWAENDWLGALGYYGDDHESLEDGIDIGVLRKLTNVKGSTKDHLGVVVHRSNLEDCPVDSHREGVVNLKNLLSLGEEKGIYASNLTLLTRSKDLVNDEIKICPMDTKGFVIQL